MSLARNIITQIFNEVNLPGNPWIQASTLGYTSQKDINDRYMRKVEEEYENRQTVTQGNEIHKQIQRSLEGLGAIEGYEIDVADPLAKVYGSIDVMLKGHIPVEIKTVNSLKDLRSLRQPKESAISQANAYAVMSHSAYSYVLYTSRDDITESRVFRVPVDFARYQADVTRLRQGIQGVPGDPIRLNTMNLNIQNMFAGFWEGIRQPWTSYPNQFEAMKPNNAYNFPGGRSQPFNQHMLGGTVQHIAENANKAKIVSQHERLGRSSPAVRPSYVGSRSERAPAWA